MEGLHIKQTEQGWTLGTWRLERAELQLILVLTSGEGGLDVLRANGGVEKPGQSRPDQT